MDEFITLSKKIEFSASHRYWNDSWSEEENLKHFGKCTSKYGHGHNYVLETTVEGPVDPDTGMIINIYNLKPILKSVLKQFDHKFFNLDTDFFDDLITTTENFSKILYEFID